MKRAAFRYRVKCGHRDHPRAQGPWGQVQEHILVAERALGRHLPAGAEVHHVDGDGRNNAPSNLVICQDKAYHKLLHWRARVIARGGNPNVGQFCNACQKFLPFEAFSVSRSNKHTGRGHRCLECSRAAWKQWDRQRRSA